MSKWQISNMVSDFWTPVHVLIEFCVCYCFCEGISGDDFFALGVRNGRIVHKYNLGSGLATIISERLNPRIKIHTVNFGRYLKNGWLKVCFIL